jgi:hypothetical protein
MKLTANPLFRAALLLTFLVFSGCAGLRSGGEQPPQALPEAGAEDEGSPEIETAPAKEEGEPDADAGPETPAPPDTAAGPGTAPVTPDADAAALGDAAPDAGAGAEDGGAEDAEGTGDEADGEDAEGTGDEADGEGGEEGEEEAKEEEGLTPEQKILEMDIKTSSLTELAAWCRSLGLGEGGGKEQMADRLRRYYELPPPPGAEEREGEGGGASKEKTIIIEAARNTEYFTLEAVDEEYARLSGDVVVTLKDGDTNYRIQADEILFNRTRNIISASGGVEFLKDDGNKKETFRGERITVDLDNWASVFMDSVSERSSDGDNNVFRFSGSLITRSGEKATILTDATITSGLEEETFWSIDASRLWLLPGNDWAFLNAVLKVGEIPVLWLPVFFYPSDEIIFHPVFGYRSREGNFVQTTTYVFGRPKANTSSEASSITKIMGNNPDDEKERHGIFLRSTGRKSKDPNEKRLFFMFDTYANLGIFTGAEFTLPSMGILRSLSLSAGLGFTRNVYNMDGTYTPFPHNETFSEWNTSRMFSETVPFRYRMDNSASFSLPGGTLSIALPFHSDTYVTRDFTADRSEEMDWFNMIKQGNNTKTDVELNENLLGYYNWSISGSFNPNMGFFNPYISSFSISNISTTLAFRHRDSAYRSSTDVSPDKTFYFPDKFTLISVSSSIEGTPLTLGGNRTFSSGGSAAGGETAPEAEDPLKGIGVPYAPWKAEKKDDAGETGDLFYNLKPPALGAKFDVPLAGGPRFTINYRLNPSGVSEMQFRSSQENWPDAKEVDWNEISSVLNMIKTDGTLGFTLQSPEGSLYTIGLKAHGSGAWQEYSMMNTDAEEFDTVSERNTALRRNYNATNFSTSGESAVTIKPFFWNDIFANTSFQYSLRGLMAKSVFKDKTLAVDEEIGSPEYTIEYGEWTKEKIESHTAGMLLSASVMDRSQDLSMVFDLPPKDASLNNNAVMRVWISETSFSERINEPFDADKRIMLPMTFTETLTLPKNKNYNFSQNVIYDPELEDFTSLTSALHLNYFKISYTMSRFTPYKLTPLGWEITPSATETFNPREFRIEYAQTFKKEKLWKDRISFNIDVGSSLSIDLQRYTYSKLIFNLSFTLGITKFLDISFTTSSENAAVFRYIQDWPFFNLDEEIPGEKDFFTDLFNSFRFDDETLRRSSGFKLKSFNLSLTHHLGDWNAKLNWRLSPYLDSAVSPPTYRFNNEISFVVQWIPISEVKTEMTYKKDVFEIK